MGDDSKPPETDELDLEITGMTCASCSSRVQRNLNRIDGVEASVNLATELAHVAYDPTRVDVDGLIAAVEQAGYGAHVAPPPGQHVHEAAAEGHRHPSAISTSRLAWGLALATPVVAISMVPPLQFPYWQWLLLVLATPVVFVVGWPFHRAALRQARNGEVGMDTLVSIGATTAWGWSLVALTLRGAGEGGTHMHMSLTMAASSNDIYLEVAAGVVSLILLGRWIETRARLRAGDAVRALAALQPTRALVLRDGVEIEVHASELQVLDRYVVRAGEQVPADGIVLDGRSTIDASAVTGESVPADIGPGDSIVGGTVNGSGRLVARATRVGQDTVLSQVAERVRRAQAGTARAQRLADRVSAIFVPSIILLAIATAIAWLATGHDVGQAVGTAVAVLIVACPCAMGLATPVALVAGTGRGAQLGILINGAATLEAVRTIDAVVFDKTGTLTHGQMQVVSITTRGKLSGERVLELAAALEASSTHPVARAITAAAASSPTSSAILAADDVREEAGVGVHGQVDELQVAVGSLHALLAGRELEPGLDDARTSAESSGQVVVGLEVEGELSALICLADEPREQAAATVRALRALGMRVMMLTGDRPATARAIAARVGIAADEVVAGVMPVDKADAVERLQATGARVAMVGDGINDAPALAQAELGIAIGGGSDVATQAGDITLVNGDVSLVPDAIRLARRTLATIRGNLIWAFGYNALAVPLAMSGRLNPLVAGLAMALSSLFVVLNSLRLLRFQPQGPSDGAT